MMSLQHSCEVECQQYGPYFTGFSKGACDNFGGTYCYYEEDCTKLRGCVDEARRQAQEDNNVAFLEYLDDSVNITDITDVSSHHGFFAPV